MAKNKSGGGPGNIKPDNPQALEQAQKAFDALSEQDKGIMLRRAGIFFLQFAWRPVAPTPELRSIVNQVSRSAFLINTFMRQASARRIDITKLTAVSEAQIREKMVDPAIAMIHQYNNDLQKILDGKKPTQVIELDYQPKEEPEDEPQEGPVKEEPTAAKAQNDVGNEQQEAPVEESVSAEDSAKDALGEDQVNAESSN